MSFFEKITPNFFKQQKMFDGSEQASFQLFSQECMGEEGYKTVEEDTSCSAFEMYQEMKEELHGEKVDDSKEAEFNKILSGELQSNDALALAIIEAASNDINIYELSEEEQENFLKKLANDEIENINIDDLSDNDTEMEDLFEEQMNAPALKYLGKPSEECTPEELNQLNALNLVDEILSSSTDIVKEQDASDGAISDLFNFFKEKTGLDTCREDVEAALKLQEEIIEKLKTAIKQGNFEKTWKELTGVEYNPEKIALYQQKATEFNFISGCIGQITEFQDSLLNYENHETTTDIYNAYINFWGQEKGEEKFLAALKYTLNNNSLSGYGPGINEVYDVRFDENGELIINTELGGEYQYGPLDGVPSDFFNNVFSDNYRQQEIDVYLQELKETTGLDFQALGIEINTLSDEALGNANAVNHTIDKYISSQEGFIDTISCCVQIYGGTVMVVGAGLCFVGNPAGPILTKIGNAISIAGMFGDEALEVIDKHFNERTFEEDKEEYKEVLREFLLDGALFASGYAIGKVSNSVSDLVLSETGNRVLSTCAEIGVDGTLSLLTDMVITGETLSFGDIGMEAISQLLGILSGSALAKINATNTKMLNDATDILNKDGLDGAVSFLKSQGASNKTIKDFRIDTEITRLNNEISLGKISPKIAATQLQEIGISKKALAQFQKAHGLEHRTPTQLMRDLIKKNGIDSIYAKEAAIDYKLSEAEAIKYSKYRENGMSAKTAIESIEFERLNNVSAPKYNSIDEVFADLEPSQKEFANELLASAEEKGYGDFIHSHPDIFKGMVDTGVDDINNINYTKLSSEQWSAIQYIAEQVDAKTIPSEVYSAIDARIQGEIYYKLFDYIDNPEAIPSEGIPHPYTKGEFINRDDCIRRLKEEAIPLRDFLNTQSIPNEVKVTRSDSCSVFDNTTINGVNIGKLMSSGKAEDIQLALELLNGNNCGVNYKNFTGTCLYDTSDQLDGVAPSEEPQIVWDLTLPKGTKGAFIEAMINNGEGAIYSECEFLLQTNSYYQISSVKYENGRYIISATVIQE